MNPFDLNLKQRRKRLRGMTAYRTARDCINILMGLELLVVVGGGVLYGMLFGPAALKSFTSANSSTFVLLSVSVLVFSGIVAILAGSIALWAMLHAIFDMADASLSSEAMLCETQLARAATGGRGTGVQEPGPQGSP